MVTLQPDAIQDSLLKPSSHSSTAGEWSHSFSCIFLRKITSAWLEGTPLSLSPCWFLCPTADNHISVVLFPPTGNRTGSGNLCSDNPILALHVEAHPESGDFQMGSHVVNWNLLLMKHHPLHLRNTRVVGCCPTVDTVCPTSPK